MVWWQFCGCLVLTLSSSSSSSSSPEGLLVPLLQNIGAWQCTCGKKGYAQLRENKIVLSSRLKTERARRQLSGVLWKLIPCRWTRMWKRPFSEFRPKSRLDVTDESAERRRSGRDGVSAGWNMSERYEGQRPLCTINIVKHSLYSIRNILNFIGCYHSEWPLT